MRYSKYNTSMRGSDWRSFRRCLAIARRLLRESATSAELIQYVLDIEGPDAYPAAKSARDKAFKRDRESLRSRLGVDFQYSPSKGIYTLTDQGSLFQFELSETSVRALALLVQTFGGQVGEHSEIQEFLDELISALPLETRRSLENPSLPIDLELLQSIDPNGIPARVWTTAWRAVKTHRKLSFHYISPAYADGKHRFHEVLPYRIQYQWGHWYLRAYRFLRRDVDGQEDRKGAHLRYRLSYLQDDDQLSVSPSVMKDPPKPPTYRVHYRLLPPLSRGVVSRHFDDMQVRPIDDGSVEVTGTCDDDWEAGRILLSYGQYCVVLGGDEVLDWMKRTIRGMMENYPYIDLS